MLTFPWNFPEIIDKFQKPGPGASKWQNYVTNSRSVVQFNNLFRVFHQSCALNDQDVIIGTKAVKEPQFVTDMCKAFPGNIIVGLDAQDGRVAIDGWAEVTDVMAVDLAKRFRDDGVSSIVYTDIARDGMMQGVNVEATVDLAVQGGIPVIASGGVTNIDDIRALAEVADQGILGAITGRAIYEGTLDVAEAQTLSDSLTGN